jgi:predicted DNA-binding transcriptional regulator AlpA
VTDNLILAANQRQSQLEAAKAAFFASGRQLVLLDPPRFEPRPIRKDVVSTKPQRVKRRRIAEKSIDIAAQRREHVEKIRQVAMTMCYREAIEATGLSHSALYRASVEGDFKFQLDPNFGRFGGVKDRNPERDGKLCERLAAFRDAGLTRRQACKQMGISACVLYRLMEQYGFVYPAKAKA